MSRYLKWVILGNYAASRLYRWELPRTAILND